MVKRKCRLCGSGMYSKSVYKQICSKCSPKYDEVAKQKHRLKVRNYVLRGQFERKFILTSSVDEVLDKYYYHQT